MNNKFVWILVAVIITDAAAGTGWYHAVAVLHELRTSELEPLAALLKEDREILRGLQAGATPAAPGILGSYLAAIRADGLPKHAEMKQKLDRLAENNAAILAIINVYSPHAKTASFKAEADKFRRYAIAWRDRGIR